MEQAKQRVDAIDARIRDERIQPLFTFQTSLAINAEQAKKQLQQKLLEPSTADGGWLVGQPVTELTAIADKPYVQLTYVINGQQGTADARLTTDGLLLQGHWWYRGCIDIHPQETGCQLEYTVYNIAPKSSRWMVWFMRADLRKQAEATYAALRQTLIS